MYIQYEVEGLLAQGQLIRHASMHLEALSSMPRTVYLNVEVASAPRAMDCNAFNVSELSFSTAVASGIVAQAAPVYIVGDLSDLVQSYFGTLFDQAVSSYVCPSYLVFRLNVYDPVNNATSSAVPLVVHSPNGTNLALHVEYDCLAPRGGSKNEDSGASATTLSALIDIAALLVFLAVVVF